MHPSRSSHGLESSIHSVAQRPAGADEFANSISQELLCVICGSVLIDPRVLRCQHCFCLRCLFATVMHDRGSHITVHCAYRCAEVTVTEGNILTLPRNTIITNLAHVVRERTRQRWLEHHAPSPRSIRAAAPSSSSGATAPEAAPGSAASGARHTPSAPTVVEEAECEWCGSSSSSVTWCQYCLSQVCESCNGVFEDHFFLCVEPHTARNTNKVPVVDGKAATQPDSGAADDNNNGDDDQAGAVATESEESLPFLFPSFTVEPLLQQLLSGNPSTKQGKRDPVSVTVESVRPVRLSCLRHEVRYTHEVFGPLCTYDVIPDGVTPFGDTLVTPEDVQWRVLDRGSTPLLFAGNVIELTGQVLQCLAGARAEVELGRQELKSVARRDYVRHNLNFQAVVLHLSCQYRTILKIVHNCIIPCLERGRAIEGLMGDVVMSQFYQQWSQGTPVERLAVQDRVAHFLKTEMKLCECMDAMIKKLSDAGAEGVELMEVTLLEVSESMRQSVKARERRAREAAKCEHAQRRLSRGLPIDAVRPSDHARAALADPTLSTHAGRTLSGQWLEKRSAVTTVRNALIGVLLRLSKLRHWVWDYTNTTVRDVGLSPADQAMLTEKEAHLQQVLDSTLDRCAAHSSRTCAWEVQLAELEASATPVSLNVIETICLFESSNLHALYSSEDTLSLFARSRELREYLFPQGSNPLHVIQSRTFQRQEEIVDVMKTVISTCMEEQSVSLNTALACEEGESLALDSMLEAHTVVVPSPAMGLDERGAAGRNDLDGFRNLVNISEADMEALRASVPPSFGAIVADHYVRDFALRRAATFGTFLIRGARGQTQPRQEEEAEAPAQLPHTTAAGVEAMPNDTPAHDGAEGDPLRTPPFVRAAPLAPVSPSLGPAPPPVVPRTDANAPTATIQDSPTVNNSNSPPSVPLDTAPLSDDHSDTEPQRVSATTRTGSTSSTSVTLSDTSGAVPRDAEVVAETLFAACDEAVAVARVPLVPKSSDPEGYGKAVGLFARHHQFQSVEPNTISVSPTQLPFFEGVLEATSSSGVVRRCRFLLDAQTGKGYVQVNTSSKKERSLATSILTSPLFAFAVVNLTMWPLFSVTAAHMVWL